MLPHLQCPAEGHQGEEPLLLGTSESQQCLDNNDSIQASSEAPKQTPICYMGELKNTNLRKKGQYQIAAQESVSSDLFNKASQPKSMPAGMGCISFFGDCISWLRFKLKEKKSNKQIHQTKFVFQGKRTVRNQSYPKSREISTVEKEKKKELQLKLFPVSSFDIKLPGI